MVTGILSSVEYFTRHCSLLSAAFERLYLPAQRDLLSLDGFSVCLKRETAGDDAIPKTAIVFRVHGYRFRLSQYRRGPIKFVLTVKQINQQKNKVILDYLEGDFGILKQMNSRLYFVIIKK